MRLIADMQISMNVLLSIQVQRQLLIIRETQDLGCISTKGLDYRGPKYPQLPHNSMEAERFLGCPLADLITIGFSSAAVHMLLSRVFTLMFRETTGRFRAVCYRKKKKKNRASTGLDTR